MKSWIVLSVVVSAVALGALLLSPRHEPVAALGAEEPETSPPSTTPRERRSLLGAVLPARRPGAAEAVVTERPTFGCDRETIVSEVRRVQLAVGETPDPKLAELVSTLSASKAPEDLLAAAQLSAASDPKASTEHLERAFRADPLHPLVLWNVARACSDGSKPSFCSEPEVEQNITSVLGNNGEYWSRRAIALFMSDDADGALDALRRAVDAIDFNDFLVENIHMLQRATATVPDAMGTSFASIGIATSNTRLEPLLTPMCRDRAASAPEWLEACLALAGRYASKTQSVMKKVEAIDLQRQLYVDAARSEEAALVKEKRDEIRRLLADSMSEDHLAVMLTDERVVSRYVAALEAGDELTAIQTFREDVDRLRRDPEYDPCPRGGGGS